MLACFLLFVENLQALFDVSIDTCDGLMNETWKLRSLEHFMN